MSRHVLISFIGGVEPKAASPRDYRTAEYRFSDQVAIKSSFFGWALWSYLNSANKKPKAWLIVGTPTSSWDRLFNIVDSNDEAVLNASAGLDGKSAAQPGALEELQIALREALEIPALTLAMIDAGNTCSSDLFSALDGFLRQSDAITLDITHGYRHMPTIVSFQLQLLHWTKKTTVRGMYYGALDMTRDGVTPVLDLSPCTEFANAAAAMAVYKTSGNYGPLGDFFPQAKEDIKKSQFFESTNNTANAKRPAMAASGALCEAGAVIDSPVAAGLAPTLCNALAWSKQRYFERRLLDRAKRSVDTDDFMKAAILLLEAAVQWQVRQNGGQAGMEFDEEQRRQALDNLRGVPGFDGPLLRTLRNAIAHGTRPAGRDAGATSELLANPVKLREFLIKTAATLRELFEQAG